MISVQLPKFEGPLGLLLYLIKKEEMDIFDIQIHHITQQYLEYIKLMKELDLEVAGEFIALAATLIQIKSQMLLPRYDENGEVIEAEDPRKELVQRLLEYQKYQEVSKALYERPLLGRDYWARGVREKLEAQEDEILLEENALFSLISAYRKAIKGLKKRVHKVAHKLQSIASRIAEIKDRLLVGQKIAMSSLIDGIVEQVIEKRRQVLITFLSLLELGRMGLVNLYQVDNYQEIYVQAKREIEDTALGKVQEYETLNAEEEAQALLAESSQILEDELVSLEDAPVELAQDPQMIFDQGIEDTALVTEEVATDDDILAAEKELEQNG
ncbi:MAG: segregation/condensation protein A [Proteobacteria bacterium]|jgi:segregation and condensation protein A|nr:segregation/condensation protein A [Pseudomonadota bacterium]